MYTASIYFLGKYRPAHFEAQKASDALLEAAKAIAKLESYDMRYWLYRHLDQAAAEIKKYSSFSVDHCDRGVSICDRPHDPWLDKVTAKLPPCPGLDYSMAV